MSALNSSDARSSDPVEHYTLEPSASSLVHAEAADHQIHLLVENSLNAGAVKPVDQLQPVQRSFPGVVQQLSSKIVHFYDKNMTLCQITTITKTNIF